MKVDIIEKLPLTESPAAAVNITKLAAEDLTESLASSAFPAPLEVFHFVFAPKKTEKTNEGDVDPRELGRFPRCFVTNEAGLLAVATSCKFAGKHGEVVEFFATKKDGGFLAEALVGCGKEEGFKASDAHSLAQSVAKVVGQRNCKTVVLELDGFEVDVLEAMVVGLLNHLSVDKRFRKDSKTKYELETVHVVAGALVNVEAFGERCKVLTKAMHVTRELVSAPANYANTVSIANFVTEKYTKLGLTVKVLKEEECLELGMGSYLGVSQGSLHPPRFLHATYKGEGPTKVKIAFVGKGIMFDSGGYNIKSASSQIETMKMDMGGMSTIFGVADVLAALKPKGVEVHFISATCENMVDSTAQRPGDIVTASNGKTIEVVNTDAEGRLTLADALVYAEKLEVDYIIDVATLTGGCIIALGYKYAAFFTDDEDLNNRFVKALDKAGELAWRLPIAKEYTDCLESKIADLSNTSYTVKCSSIAATLFLKEFVKSTKWLHWDIAGTAQDNSSLRGTGYGVRTLVNLVFDLAGES
ncbi:leucine aminopeptidase-related protein [Babesia gibsoni]|uniref:Leucine aminopeptidase-related protein n=1 Tax=Babesia gibsoni TaxID=33632 RepID=A0AAD8LPJ5_BABGI|nr:leucine aminopeptidase-related protein [Babesia gibsoni]